MVTIREARGEDFPRVYPLLHELNPEITREQWQQLFVDHSKVQNDRYGWMLVDGGEVVGFLGTTIGERLVRGERLRLCNTTAWTVRKEYRAHSLSLYARVLADKRLEVTNLSPTQQVLAMMQKLGFSLMDKTERIILPVVTPASLLDRARVLTHPEEVERALEGESLRLFRDHQLPYNRHALLLAPEGPCYLMMNRSPKAVAGRRIKIPFARVHHIGAPEIFNRHTEKASAYIATAFGVAAMIVDERMLRGRIPWHSFERRGGPKQAAFRSSKLTDQDIDGLYTEAVLLNF
jgi:hypothetical protein